MTDYNDGKWHGWNGGECPVHPDAVVEVVTESGRSNGEWVAKRVIWRSDVFWAGGPIPHPVAFRVIRQHCPESVTAEIEITPEMIAAAGGAMSASVVDYAGDVWLPEDWAPDVIRAVLRVFLERKEKIDA